MELKLTPMLDTIRAQDKELARLREAMIDIEELVDGYIDITNEGGPNLAMQIQMVIDVAKGKRP